MEQEYKSLSRWNFGMENYLFIPMEFRYEKLFIYPRWNSNMENYLFNPMEFQYGKLFIYPRWNFDMENYLFIHDGILIWKIIYLSTMEFQCGKLFVWIPRGQINNFPY